jgi:hypothetical protein
MIFVFGSNLAGIHGAGAARYAYEKLGAEWGVGRGLTGSCYALPTKNEDIWSMPWPWVKENIREFVQYAKDNPFLLFALTPVGTGLAGHSKRDVWEALQEFGIPDNVYLTSSWVTG